MAKGGSFERLVCYQLSRWWTGRKDELIFWRTSNSGGGATVRGRKGIKNRAHAGDITAIEEVGRPLTDLITFELKTGYNKTANLHTMLDFKKQTKAGKKSQRMYEQWFEQSITAMKRAGAQYWILIHKRDGGEPFCFMPSLLYVNLCLVAGGPTGVFNPLPEPFVTLKTTVRFADKSEHPLSIVGMKFRHFLFHVDPRDVRLLRSKS